jgi:hypothetical protein
MSIRGWWKAAALAASLATPLAAAAQGAAPVPAGASKPGAATTRSGSQATKRAPATATASAPAPARQDTTLTLKADEEGTVFRSLTVSGEDRIRLDLQRPALELELDPAKAPGLEWGSARDVLDRTTPDLIAPLLRSSSHQPSPWVARPWLGRFATGAVARFRPEVEGVERWKLTVANSRGESVASFEGRGEVPAEIAWDGRSKSGAPVMPGLTYSYVFEAVDRAGNKRNFVGRGFQVNAYRIDAADGPVLVFTGAELDPAGARPGADPAPAPIVLEAASWLNQAPPSSAPIRVTATARSLDQADQLARRVAAALTPYVAFDPARLQPVAEVQPDAPDGGTVRIAPGR